MGQSRFSPTLVAGILVALFFGVALYLRVVLPYDQVFVGDWIKFTGVDAYYHMRLVDNLLHHFPHYMTFDPYTFYPHGTTVPWPPGFGWLLAGVIWLGGLGSPTQHTIDVVGVHFPAVLAALTVIPVYFIGKALLNRWAGVMAAGLIVILPGEFLGRSILGFTDHHVAEVLFTTTAVLFLILAVKTAGQRGLAFHHLKQRDWAIIARPLIYSLLAGVFLGTYLLTWVGGLLFVFLIFAYFVLQFIIDHLRGKSTDYLGIVGVLCLLVAAAIALPFLPETWRSATTLPSLAIAILVLPALCGISRLMANRAIRPAYYPLAVVGLGLAGLAILYVIDPSLVKSMIGQFRIFTPGVAGRTILEVQPLLFPGGNFSLSVAWGNFTTGFFLSFISLGILVYLIIRRGEADKTVFVIWSLIILAATLGQRRFAYYFAVNVALLTGYFSWLVLQFVGFKEAGAEPPQVTEHERKTAKQKRRQREGRRVKASRVNMALGVIAVIFLVFYPNIGPLPDGRKPAIDVASQAVFAPSNAWCESLSWLEDNTPEPFGDPDSYYELYEPSVPKKRYDYPESAYGVMAWWDYGHWITRIAHRMPISNPFQKGARDAARFFTAQDEASASKVMDKLGAKYAIMDYATATTKFYALPTWAGSNKEEFYDVYYQRQDGRLKPLYCFYPEYYRSLAVRLYNFDGSEVIPQKSTVIAYEERTSPDGQPYKEITGSESFPSYEEAEAYVATQESGNYRIIGDDPFVSPVPLERLEHYTLVHSSEGAIMEPNGGMISLVKIFQRGEPPAPPAMVSPGDGATVPGTSITFGWDPVDGADKYWIQVSTDVDFTDVFHGNWWGYHGCSYNDFPNDGSMYYCRVKARSGAGWGEWSASWRFTNRGPPAPPTMVSPGDGARVPGTSITFGWDPVDGADKYWVQVSTDVDFTDVFHGNWWGYHGCCYSEFLEDGTTYYWRVKARNDAGWGQWSPPWSFTNQEAKSEQRIEGKRLE